MIKITEYAGQKVGVFGLGKAGVAAVAALKVGGAKVFSWDDCLSSPSPLAGEGGGGGCKSQPQSAEVAPHPNPPPQGGRGYLGRNTKHYKYWDWKQLKALVLSPGVPLTHPKPHPIVELAREYNVPIVGEVELLFRACPEATYIGITGTNGKSTTTTLIGHILQEAGVECQVGGNLGTPALALQPLGKGGVFVLEMSSYQLDLLHTTRFNVAVLLNITPDHLDRHGDMAGYIAAKQHIFERQMAGDVAVVADGGQWQVNSEVKIVKFSVERELAEGIYVQDGVLYDSSTIHHPPFTIHQISSLTGKHNWQNAAAAYAAARAVGVVPEKIYAAMQNFAGLSHRLQLVAEINGVKFINDSKATNADATANALAPYKNIYWILGGKQKAGGIETLTPYLSHITHAFLIGEAAPEFAKTLEGKVPYTQCGTLEVSVTKAFALAQTSESQPATILLSPACASFDQFKSFEQRGDIFCELVQKIKNGINNAA
jgi:UDP-N-acetylmuramoylalanine--D-glutamate ligase